MWFQKKPQKPLPTEPVNYPVGICVKTDKGHYFLQRDGKRYRIPTARVLESWSFPFVVETTEVALKGFPVSITKFGFRDGTLLNNFSDGKIYLVSGGKLRHVVSPDALSRLGIDKTDAIIISQDELNIMKLGEDIY